MIPDIPTYINGYAPTNFNETFEGAVPAERGLARSLNVPAVLMLRRFGVARFHHLLQTANLRNITRSADHYGLSLILGGAEANLWDLCQVYANMSCTLGSFTHQQANYRKKEWQNLNLTLHKKIDFGSLTKQKPLFDAASIWHTFNAMKKVNRPEGDEAWEFYDSAIKLAWKTGTSFGNHDAWDENFKWSDGPSSRRVWTLTKQADGRYIGTADDVVGKALGEVSGNALRWRYVMALPVDGKTYHVDFDDWMFLMDYKVMLNRSYMSKWGFNLGEVTLSFVKR